MIKFIRNRHDMHQMVDSIQLTFSWISSKFFLPPNNLTQSSAQYTWAFGQKQPTTPGIKARFERASAHRASKARRGLQGPGPSKGPLAPRTRALEARILFSSFFSRPLRAFFLSPSKGSAVKTLQVVKYGAKICENSFGYRLFLRGVAFLGMVCKNFTVTGQCLW